MSETLVWWLMAQVVGLSALPLCLTLFRRLPDRGYALSKPFALLLLGYLFWILNIIGVLPNTTQGIVLSLLLLFAGSAWLYWRRQEELLTFVRERWRFIAVTEALFFVAFITAAYLRSFTPDLGETEKPMDFMFLNALTHAHSFPPEDPWLSGENVAYYYFGYLIVSIMTRLSGLDTSVGYNLGISMIAALSVTAAFGLVYCLVAPRERRAAEAGPGTPAAGFTWPSLRRPVVFGLVGALLLAVMGNLEGVLEALAAGKVGSDGFWSWVGIEALAKYDSAQWYPDGHWFWWRATRMIEASPGLEGIHEFPFFSFLLGDLHPHVMALPFVLLAVGVALSLLRSDEPLDLVVWLERPLAFVAIALIVGGLAFLNTWDMPTMAVVFTLVALARNRLLAERWSWGLAADTAGFVAPLFLAAFLAYIPFFFGGFDSQASGFSAEAGKGTRLFHALIHWGPFAAIVLPYAGWRIASADPRPSRRAVYWSLAPALAVIALWLFWDLFAWSLLPDSIQLNNVQAGFWDRIGERGWNWLTVLALGGTVSLLSLALWSEVESSRKDAEERTAHIFALALSSVAALLVFGAEFVFIQDFFNSRMNTIFKLYYQAWLLLSVAGAFALSEMLRGVTLRVPQPESRHIAFAGVALAGGVVGVVLGNDPLTWSVGFLLGAGVFSAVAMGGVLFWRATSADAEVRAGVAWRPFWASAAAVVLVAAFVYPLLATWNRTGGCVGHPIRLLEGPSNCGDVFGQRSLDGLAQLKESNPDEYQAAVWLMERRGRPVIAEAAGDGYRWDTSRLAAITGLPTVLGWQGHEEQWRGGSDLTNPRHDDLEALYTSGDEAVVQSIIQKYGVDFVVLGDIEVQKYESPAIGEMSELVELAFQQGSVNIYRVRPVLQGEVLRE